MRTPQGLRKWVAEMRALGIHSLRTEEGLELVLGPERADRQELPAGVLLDVEAKAIRNPYDDPALGVPSLPRRAI